ncbi:MAG: preprotein translocase subunit SecD, partial [Acidimicrobiales bacterium]
DPSPSGRLRMGPVPLVVDQENEPGQHLTGVAVESAAARLTPSGGWAVNPVFKSGSPGIDDFNALALQCFNLQPTCPTGRIAIEIDGYVESAPNVQAPAFERDVIQITGQFSTDEAKDLALALNFGALPLELTPQESRIVSSTLGEDALDAGVFAGLVGVVLVSIYLIAYYRWLGVIAILSLLISGALLWTAVAWLGESQGLALTLAGVTGLIVSIGVSVDSNVVYFEHLKEDVRNGRTVRSAVERAFPIAYSTIVKADVASLIAAVVLYWLTVGQVRGFALFLGLATVLDLIATYFFMGPAIRLMAARGFGDRPRSLGIPDPTGQDEAMDASNDAATEPEALATGGAS